MSEWDDNLVAASFGGIEFDVVSVRDAVERRVVDHEYLGRDGADLEDTGRAARPTTYSAVFHGDGYLNRLTELQRLIDTGETRAMRHPLLGTWQAKAIRMSIEHDQSMRDAAKVELEFKEDGTSTTIPLIESIGKSEQGLANGLAALDTAYTELDETVDEVADLQTDAGNYMDDLAAGTDNRETRFLQLDAYAKAAVGGLDDLGRDVAAAASVRAIRDVQFAARGAREAYDAAQPSIVDLDLAADVSLSSVALALYGDPSREADLLRLNTIRNPFLVEAGKRIKVHGH